MSVHVQGHDAGIHNLENKSLQMWMMFTPTLSSTFALCPSHLKLLQYRVFLKKGIRNSKVSRLNILKFHITELDAPEVQNPFPQVFGKSEIEVINVKNTFCLYYSLSKI